jgi:hypothetical protein
MDNIFENITMLKVCNGIFLIIGLFILITLVTKLFKNTLINHTTSDSGVKNFFLFTSAIIATFTSGNILFTVPFNSQYIEELKAIRSGSNVDIEYINILIQNVKDNFSHMINLLIVAIIAYIIYILIIKNIDKELEKMRKNVVHWKLKK